MKTDIDPQRAPNWASWETWAMWIVALAIAFTGGMIANWVGTPLPWLLGALVATAIAMVFGITVRGLPLSIPQPVRMAFITVIGVAIGGTASPDMFTEIGAWWPSLLAVLVFVGGAQAMNYQIFRRIGAYDRPTAFYSAMPGGLIESVQLGEEAGGNPALLAVQHFTRITLTVIAVPLIYWAVRGEAVGSSAGVSLDQSSAPIAAPDVALLIGCAVIGGWGGRFIGLPASIVTGPVLLSVLVHAIGWTEAQPPDWMIAIAQLVVGLGLATRFQGIPGRALWQGLRMGALTVTLMLSLGAALAAGLSAAGGQPWQVLFMVYSPGGVVEMGLIALSLEVSPVLVTLHHLLRITITVMVMPFIGRAFLARY
ncbi:MAG: AbrB family transcriptional regulator [Pseudomonadota bacterium]